MEVVLAIGIVAFALIAVVALLPMSLQLAGESEDETRAANLLSAVVADRQATPPSLPSRLFQMEVLTNTLTYPVTNEFGITDDGKFTGGDMRKARYRVSYVIVPPSTNRLDPFLIHFRISWPAQNTNSPGSLETVAAYSEQ